MTPNLKQFDNLDLVCNKICNESKIRFCGVINTMGRLVAGSFKDGIQPLDNDQQRQMMYMQSKLELSMKGEFNDNLGNVNYVLTYRDNLVIINIPLKNQQYHILISAERNANARKIAENAMMMFENIVHIIQLNTRHDSILSREPKDTQKKRNS